MEPGHIAKHWNTHSDPDLCKCTTECMGNFTQKSRSSRWKMEPITTQASWLQTLYTDSMAVKTYILVGGFKPSDKYESPLGIMTFPIHGKNVPNHQPDIVLWWRNYPANNTNNTQQNSMWWRSQSLQIWWRLRWWIFKLDDVNMMMMTMTMMTMMMIMIMIMMMLMPLLLLLLLLINITGFDDEYDCLSINISSFDHQYC